MKIETKFNIGDIVRIREHTGAVTDISVWVVGTREDETEIEYRIDDPHKRAWVTEGFWGEESTVEAVPRP